METTNQIIPVIVIIIILTRDNIKSIEGTSTSAITSSAIENGSGTTGVSSPAKNGGHKGDINGGLSSSSEGGTKRNVNSYNCNDKTNNHHSSSTKTVQSPLSLPSESTKAPLNKSDTHNNSASSLTLMNSNSILKGSGSDKATESQRQQQQQQQQAARSKATYRNRQQEETDPDFRRGAGMVVVQPTPYNPQITAAGYSASAGGGGCSGHGSGNGGGLIGGVYYPNIPNNNNVGRVAYNYAQQNQYHHQYHHHQQQQQQQQHYGTQYYPIQPTVTLATSYGTGGGDPSVPPGRGQGQSRMQYQQHRRQQEHNHHELNTTSSSSAAATSTGTVPTVVSSSSRREYYPTDR